MVAAAPQSRSWSAIDFGGSRGGGKTDGGKWALKERSRLHCEFPIDGLILKISSGRRLLRGNDTWASHPENNMTTYENRLIASSHRRIFFCDPRNLVGRRLRGIYQHN